MRLFSQTIVLTLGLLHSAAVFAADVPVIGIITREGTIPDYNRHFDAYIPAGYVKWLESAGARTIAIYANATEEDVDMIFPQINGLLMPGGNAGGAQAEKRLYQLAKEANENGEIFPILGICWGFQNLALLERGTPRQDSFDLVAAEAFEAEDISLPLEFTTYGSTQSAIFDTEMQELLSKPIAYNHHTGGILPGPFMEDPVLTAMYAVTSINHDMNGKAFISSLEARDFDTYPFWGVSILTLFIFLASLFVVQSLQLFTLPFVVFIILSNIIFFSFSGTPKKYHSNTERLKERMILSIRTWSILLMPRTWRSRWLINLCKLQGRTRTYTLILSAGLLCGITQCTMEPPLNNFLPLMSLLRSTTIAIMYWPRNRCCVAVESWLMMLLFHPSNLGYK